MNIIGLIYKTNFFKTILTISRYHLLSLCRSIEAYYLLKLRNSRNQRHLMERRIVSCLLLIFLYSHLPAQQDSTSLPDDTINRLLDPFNSFILQVRDSKKVLLQWAVQPGVESEYFTIEKNIDGKNFETIAVIKSLHTINRYEFTDEMPTRGNSTYRIRLTARNGDSFFSDSSSVNIPGSSLVNFYPNPMDNVLIIRSTFTADILITDAMGKSRVSRIIGVGPSVIDVSTLEKGVYLLRITDKVSSQQQVEKIIKN